MASYSQWVSLHKAIPNIIQEICILYHDINKKAIFDKYHLACAKKWFDNASFRVSVVWVRVENNVITALPAVENTGYH